MKFSYLVDTDWMIDHLNNREPVASRIKDLRKNGIAISMISLAELYEGVYRSQNPETAETGLLEFLSEIAILGIDEQICRRFGKVRAKLRTQGLLIGDLDIIIASTAICYQVPLCTNNLRHYERIEGLNIVSI